MELTPSSCACTLPNDITSRIITGLRLLILIIEMTAPTVKVAVIQLYPKAGPLTANVIMTARLSW
jgi:hypothetical protein